MPPNSPRLFGIVTNNTIFDAIQALNAKLDTVVREILMSESTTQGDINNVAAVLNAFVTDVTNDVTTIGNALAAIQTALANGQPVDTSVLDAAAASVANVQASLDTVSSAATGIANPSPTAPVNPAPVNPTS